MKLLITSFTSIIYCHPPGRVSGVSIYYGCCRLQLLDQPVLLADHLSHLHLLLAPVEVFLLVGEVSLQQVVSSRIATDISNAIVEHIYAFLLDVEVCLDIVQRSLYNLAALAVLNLHVATEIEDAGHELLHPLHLLLIVTGVFLTELLEAERLEILALCR